MKRRSGGEWNRVFGRTILGAARAGHHRVFPGAGAQEALALGNPRRVARFHAEEVVQEILFGGILVQAPDEVGDGAVEVIAVDDRGVEQKPARSLVHHAGLVVCHAFEHLEFDTVIDPLAGAQDHGVGEIEQVVAGDAGFHQPGLFRFACFVEHPFEVGIHLFFRLIGSLRPIVQSGLDLFHRKIRAFDQADLDARAAAGHALAGPLDELFLHGPGVREIGLEDDAGL